MKPVIKSLIKKNNKITIYFDFKREDGTIAFTTIIEGKTEEEIYQKLKKRWKLLKDKNEEHSDSNLKLKKSLEFRIEDLAKEIL